MTRRVDIPVRLPKKDAQAIENEHNASPHLPKTVGQAVYRLRRESPTTASVIARIAGEVSKQVSERAGIELADMMVLIAKLARAEHREQQLGEMFEIPEGDPLSNEPRGTERVLDSLTDPRRIPKAG